MIRKEIKARIDDLDKTLAYFIDKVEKIENQEFNLDDELKDYIKKCVWDSLQSWLNSGHRNIVSYVNDKEITTKFIRDEIAELNEKKFELERVAEQVNEALVKYGGEE